MGGDIETPEGPQSVRTLKAHLAYQPLFPCASKYLQYRWDNASYALHRRKLKSTEPVLNITPMKIYSHLGQGWKRQQELLHIAKDNQRILFCLINCKPTYNLRSWEEDWRRHLRLTDSIARYPRGWSNQLTGPERPTEKPNSCCKDQKISPKAGKKEKEQENGKTEERRALQQNRANPAPKLDELMKSISPESPQPLTQSTDTIQVATNAGPPADVSDMSNAPHTPETPKQETASLTVE
ncbi:uncharacterized protein cfap97d2 [Cheilinus undulatus]|uniref:uncharacterized protein cfap97d2 n=1 Tax=Cheilinus undulatus TaxID=241271 RepID=UPI001BD5DAF9|nr:uncharacterized protein cfap97d2 [Cheilinus undulatus]